VRGDVSKKYRIESFCSLTVAKDDFLSNCKSKKSPRGAKFSTFLWLNCVIDKHMRIDVLVEIYFSTTSIGL
jgi:hypothetical protein